MQSVSSTVTPSLDSSPAIAPTIAMRWSPLGDHLRARSSRWRRPSHPCRREFRDLDAQAPQDRSHDAQAVALLRPQLRRPSQTGDALGPCRGQQKERQFVDEVRDLGGVHSVARRLEVLAVMLPDRFRAPASRVGHIDVAAHAPEHVEQSRPGGIQPHVLDGDLRSGTSNAATTKKAAELKSPGTATGAHAAGRPGATP